MNRKIIIIIAFLFGCNHAESGKRASAPEKKKDSTSITISTALTEKNDTTAGPDTTSMDYLIYILKNEKQLNSHWLKKLDEIDGFFYSTEDTLAHLELVRNWSINDSIYVIIINSSTHGTSNDDFLLTIKNKHEVVSAIHIGDNDDSDLSFGNPYFYTEYKLLGDRKVRLYNHKVVGEEGGVEKDWITSIQTWTIENDGKSSKK